MFKMSQHFSYMLGLFQIIYVDHCRNWNLKFSTSKKRFQRIIFINFHKEKLMYFKCIFKYPTMKLKKFKVKCGRICN